MIATQKMMEMLTGRESLDSFIERMIARSNDFAKDHRLFEEAIDYFKANLSREITPSVDDLIDAIHRQTVSNWLFSSHLGFQANLDHFLNPVARTFVDVDPEIYLRERVARALPEYASAQAIFDNFYCQLSPEQKEVYEGVTIYITHLETIVPKIAHYNGFELGNKLLPLVMPGYEPDAQLTVRYCMMLEKFLQYRLESK